MRGFDFDGVVTAGLKPGPGDVVITGRPPKIYHDILKFNLPCPVYCFPSPDLASPGEIAAWKSLIIKALMVTVFFEDNPYQAECIRRACPGVEVIMPPFTSVPA